MYKRLRETTTPNKFIEVTMDYNKGGMNYFSGQMLSRGYYIHVSPVEIENGMKCTRVFSGYYACVLVVPRASLRAQLAADDLVRAKEDELVAAVCAKNGLTLK